MSTPPPGGRPPYPPSQPPNPQPPYGQPYVGDPRYYWRYQRDQQRRAWKAQRQMLRYQSRAMRRPSLVGPVLLVTIGILALLMVTGRLAADSFWAWYGHWWPILLIVLGVAALVEWFLDSRSGTPVSRSFGGYVGLVIFLLIAGAIAGSWSRNGIPFVWHDGSDDDFFSAFNGPQHTRDMEPVTVSVPAGSTLQVQIQDPRGDVQIASSDSSDSSQISVISHAVVYGGDDSEADKLFAAHRPRVTVSGSSATILVDPADNLRSNLTITLPRSASVNVNTAHGDVSVTGLGGNVEATVSHGDFQAASIGGYVHEHLVGKGGSVSAHQITGDVTADGLGDDITLSDISGQVRLSGDFTGDIHLERIAQPIHFHSTRTDLALDGGLPGDLSMDLDSLHATQTLGQLHLVTRAKDIELNQVFGPSDITDSDGTVSLSLAGDYPAQVRNNKGDIEISLPPGLGYQVNGQTHNGDIVSDFPLTISGDQNKTVSGTIGKGGATITLMTENADLHLSKGPSAPPRPPLSSLPFVPGLPGSPAAPHPPAAPNAPHLRLPHGQSADSATQ